ncbi:MAG: OmpA family protein [Flavisolibacter sp.]
MTMKYFLYVVLAAIIMSSCVSNKKLKAEQDRYAILNTSYSGLQNELKDCRDKEDQSARKRVLLETELEGLNKQVALLKDNNNLMVGQLKNLSVISSSQAESIKKSLDNIGSKDSYIQNLQQEISRKDSLNMTLVMNLKGALKDVNDQDINVKVEKGVVFISISDKMLFKSGSYNVNDKAMGVLGKVAQVLNSRPELEFMVEGHTDNIPIKTSCIADNWDLSTKRATSVVRLLQNQFSIDPKRMTAGGRSEFLPLLSNYSSEGKASNRRTRIVILPQLDQFFKLLEKS